MSGKASIDKQLVSFVSLFKCLETRNRELVYVLCQCTSVSPHPFLGLGLARWFIETVLEDLKPGIASLRVRKTALFIPVKPLEGLQTEIFKPAFELVSHQPSTRLEFLNYVCEVLVRPPDRFSLHTYSNM